MYLGADAWQSPNGHDILGVVIYRLIEDGSGKIELEAMPLNFVQLAKSHTGEYLAETLRLVVEKFDVQHKICGIVTDNASNNMSMVAKMKKFKWHRFKGDSQWIRCYAHILNLIARSILKKFCNLKKNTGGNEDSAEETESKDEEPEILIRRYDEDTSIDEYKYTADGQSNTSEQYDADDEVCEAELSMQDIHDLSDEDEDEDLYTSASCKQTLAK
ncbi:hypothetical protein PTTG_30439, partial [Puccinia triticina 1-1 BBBD Race 1]